ncbi:MAG: hypothetical protein HN769_11645 [Anaerolineae bacterium]|jgi:hypothetical protein|nr:hypothetical protein [Anaerolineae bacterium]
MQQTRTTDNPDLDNALIQCLRIFARHGCKIREEKQSVGALQKSVEGKNTPKKETKINASYKS